MLPYVIFACDQHNIGTLLEDISNWLCEGLEYAWYPAALWLGCFMPYVCAFFLMLSYTRYVVCYLEPKVRVHKGFTVIVFVISIVYAFCLLLSQFNGMFYWIDGGNIYHRGDWYFLSQVPAVLIQFHFYGLSLTYAASTVARLIIFIDIQSEQAFLVEQIEKKLLQERLSIIHQAKKSRFRFRRN